LAVADFCRKEAALALTPACPRAREENGGNMKEQQSIEEFRNDLRRMHARVQELERQLADAINGKLPEDARLDPDMIMVSSMVSAATGDPMVVLRWFTHVTQFAPDQARDLALNLLDAAEAAKSDAFLAGFMKGHGPEAGAQLVAAFREYRAKGGK
jgi:hypothetical protein